MQRVDCGHEVLELLPDRALHWPRRRTILVADLHLGKPAAFRDAGVPVPDTTSRTLARLGALVDRVNAARVIILGDLLHARTGRTEATLGAFDTWRERHAAIDITLVRGNHDSKSGDPPRDWRITCVDAPWIDEGLALCHTPEEARLALGSSRSEHSDGAGRASFALCGHVHPVFSLSDGGVSSVRSVCFWITEGGAVGVLPAFGDFTGGQRVRPDAGDRLFLFGDSTVIELKQTTRPRRG